MRTLISLLFIMLVGPVSLQAQSNYKPGFAVTMEGDTLRGFINYREWEFTPSAVTFKEDKTSGAEKVLDVSNTRYFEISGMEAYERYEGRITMNQVAAGRISYESKALLEQVVAFLKINYTGELVDLLSNTDQVKTRYFFREKDGSQPQELYYNRYYAASNNSSKVVVQRGYAGQLQHLAGKYHVSNSRLNSDIENAQYNQNDLLNIISKINGIRVSSPAPKDVKSSSSRFFAGAALNTSTFRITGITGLHVPERDPISFMPLLSFGFDTFLNKHIQKLYFRVEGALTAANYHAENHLQSENTAYYFSYKVSQQTFSVSPQLLFSVYNTDNLKFNVGAVTQLNFSNYSENHFQYNRRATFEMSPDVVSEEGYKDFLRTEPFWFAYGLRAGAVINRKFEIYSTYIPYMSITQYTNRSIEVRSLYLGMNYLFSK